MFSCEFCEISKNTFFYRTPPVAASEYLKECSGQYSVFLKIESAKLRGLRGKVSYVSAWVTWVRRCVSCVGQILRGLRGLLGSKYFLRGSKFLRRSTFFE